MCKDHVMYRERSRAIFISVSHGWVKDTTRWGLFAENTGFEDSQMSLTTKAARDIYLSSQPLFFANNWTSDHLDHLIFNWELKSIYENRKKKFKEVYKFWNKLKNKLNHGFSLIYNMQKK
jgi:pyruvoyl-dependent arginine decarboxylase (PvlArgDC)